MFSPPTKLFTRSDFLCQTAAAMQGRDVVIRHSLLLYILTVSLSGTQISLAQGIPSGQPTATRPRQVHDQQIYLHPPQLSGDIETANGQYRINLANLDEQRTVTGFAVIQLGNAEQLDEAVKLRFTLTPQEGMIYPLWPLAARGDFFSLMIYDLRGVMIYQKIAPVKKGDSANWAVAAPMNAIVSPRLVTTPVAPAAETEVRVSARLTGGVSESDPFYLALELTTQRDYPGAGVTVTGQGINQRKAADLKGTTLVQFKLPDELPEQKLTYLITDATGRLLAQGEADLHTLLADDYVSVSEIRPDRQSYAPGDTARLTISFQGSAPEGCRVEVLARNSQSTIIYRDMRRSDPGIPAAMEFSFAIPKDNSGPLIFEYKVLDARSGKLFDSGDSQLEISGTKPDGN